MFGLVAPTGQGPLRPSVYLFMCIATHWLNDRKTMPSLMSSQTAQSPGCITIRAAHATRPSGLAPSFGSSTLYIGWRFSRGGTGIGFVMALNGRFAAPTEGSARHCSVGLGRGEAARLNIESRYSGAFGANLLPTVSQCDILSRLKKKCSSIFRVKLSSLRRCYCQCCVLERLCLGVVIAGFEDGNNVARALAWLARQCCSRNRGWCGTSPCPAPPQSGTNHRF